MNPHWISISALAVMFVVATIWPVNMGVLAYVGAFLVGTLAAGMAVKDIIAGFPGDLFLTLVGITYLFAIAQNNGTIEWLVQLAVRGVRGRIAAIPWIMFGITAALTALGAVSPAAVAIIAPIALGFATRHGINALMMGLLVIHGAQAGGFSPISIYGGITNAIVKQANLPLNESFTCLASFGVNTAAAILLFFAFGGRRLLSATAPSTIAAPVAVPEVITAQRGPQAFGDSEAEAYTEERLLKSGQGNTLVGAEQGRMGADGNWLVQSLTLAGLIVLAVLVLKYKLNTGFTALTIGLVLSLLSPQLQKRAVGQVSWPEIMLITGVGTYVAVLEKMGTVSFVGHSVAGMSSPLWAALLLCLIGAVVSAFASSTAVLSSLIPLAVPFLQSGSGVSAIGFIGAMAVASTIVDVSPFSTNGAIVLATAREADRESFFRKLVAYGALVTVVAPVVVWLLFIVPGHR